MSVNLSEIPGAFHLPRPNWEVIRAWVEQHVAEADREAAWADVVLQWLAVLNQALGDTYRAEQGQHVLLFAPQEWEEAAALAEIDQLLGDAAAKNWPGPLVALLFADADTYHSQFDPEGEFGSSVGCCVRTDDYLYVALCPGVVDEMQATVAHEIAHACLSHLKLPLWLEEGITQHVQGQLHSRYRRFDLTTETAEEARRYWRANGLQAFWWGGGFSLPDEGQGFSYLLAQILFHFLSTDHAEQVPDFVRHARVEDAGDGAARNILGKGLAELAAQFLGPGAWEPFLFDAWGYCQRGRLYLSHGKYDQAAADFDEAVRLAPQDAEAHTNRGCARYELGQYAPARADFERAIELNPRDAHAHHGLAWFLATSPEEEHRDGKRAVELATRACELTGFGIWCCLGTLAAAWAEAGDFEEAVSYAKESLRTAPPEERPGCKKRLRLYKQGEPYRDAKGGTSAETVAESSAEGE